MRPLFKALLTFNSTQLLLVVYLVKNKITLNDILFLPFSIAWHPELLSYGTYLVATVLIAIAVVSLKRLLPASQLKSGDIIEISNAQDRFLPTYLGYFFVALSVPNLETLVFLYLIIYILTYLSQTLYFNPIFIALGYKFYNLKTKNGADIFLMSKSDYKTPHQINIMSALSINDYTFIEGIDHESTIG